MPILQPIDTTARDFVPDRVGDELVLRLAGPIAIAEGVATVHTLHLLQEQDVGRETLQPVAQLVDHHAARQV